MYAPMTSLDRVKVVDIQNMHRLHSHVTMRLYTRIRRLWVLFVDVFIELCLHQQHEFILALAVHATTTEDHVSYLAVLSLLLLLLLLA